MDKSQDKIFTVRELTRFIKGEIEPKFSSVNVQGELSGVSFASSGHVYFALKDEKALLSCALFKGSADKVPFRLEEGMEVVLRGSISVYEPRGSYQMIVREVSSVGTGDLHLAFEQLKKKLSEEGLFAPEYKKKLPFLPKRIGIVTAQTGAVIRDILSVIDRRFSSVHLLLDPVRVQGEGSAEEIAAAIDRFNEKDPPDLLIVGRGGGSMEDLQAFNSEVVARAAFRSNVPIISAVGHETDTCIFDYVADVRAPTPSVAAELAVPEKKDLFLKIRETETLLWRAWTGRIQSYRYELREISAKIASPRHALQSYAQSIDEWMLRCKNSIKHLVNERKHARNQYEQRIRLRSPEHQISVNRRVLITLSNEIRQKIQNQLHNQSSNLKETIAKVDALSPMKTIARGYSIAGKVNGKPIKSISDCKPEDQIRTRLKDGAFISKVIKILPEESTQIRLFDSSSK